MVVGNVKEPNVFLDVGKVNFGPLLLNGKNKETVRLRNLEDIPIPFNFDRESVKGLQEYGDSLHIKPMSGVIKADSEIPVEISF
jgi:hydrocephalus-inducing protein